MKKLLKGILTSAVLLSVTACGGPSVPELKEESLTLEYGQDPYDLSMKDLLENYDDVKEQYQFSLSLFNDENEEIKEDSQLEDALLQVGEYTLKINYADDEAPLQLPVTIKDTVAPEFKDFKEKVSVDYGYDKDLTKLFSAEDMADVTIRIDGEVDTKKAGDYKVTVIAEDASGNQTEKECTITVKEKPKASNSSSSNSNAVSSGSSGSGSSSATRPSGNSGSSSGSNSTSGGSSSSSGSSSSGDDQPKCYLPDNQIGNSGKLFDTKESAYNYGEEFALNNELDVRRYFVIEVYDTCNNFMGWTVDFEYR